MPTETNRRKDIAHLSAFAVCWCLLLGAPVQAQNSQTGASSTLSKAHLPKEAVRQILRDIEATAYDTPNSWDNELRIERLTLGGAPALVLKGSDLLCGATGNCQVWIFRRTGNRWHPLLPRGQPLIADSLAFGPNLTQGVEDLAATMNSSASATNEYTYKFDGAVYRGAEDR